jgi:hypothetical protein
LSGNGDLEPARNATADAPGVPFASKAVVVADQ